MNPYFEDFLETFSPQCEVSDVSQSRLAEFRSSLPSALLEFWDEKGWSGYADGIMWTTDPVEFKPALEAWLEPSGILDKDIYTVIARSAFGKMFVWGKNSGMSIIIDPFDARVTTIEPNFDPSRADNALVAFFASKDKDYFDFEDYKEKKIFSRALKKLGRLKSDEMYGFEPALALGGMPKIENLTKVKMIEHLVLLAQISEIEFVHMDVRRHL